MESKLPQKTPVIWFTGFSGAGKSTIAQALKKHLCDLGYLVCTLDGDDFRNGLNSDLSFSEKDRNENVRRVTHVANFISKLGFICICSLISPYQQARDFARKIIGSDFKEVYIKCSIKECERRDPKGLYAKQRSGEISGLTGIEAPYEEPTNPDLIIETDKNDIITCVNLIMELIDKE